MPEMAARPLHLCLPLQKIPREARLLQEAHTKNQKKILCYPSKILEALKDRVVSDESDAVLRMFQSRIGNVYERGDEELLRLEKRDGALFNSVRSANGEVRSRRVQDPRRLWRDIEEGRLKELSPDAWHEG